MADATYQPGIYRKQGSNELVVASGGSITVESGGYIANTVQTVSSSATTITASGLSLITGTTVGPTYLIANPIVGVAKYLSLNASSSAATHRAVIAPASTGVSFDSTGGNSLTLATSATRGVTLIGMTTASYRIVGVYTGASITGVVST